jgi:hypothetical protein
MNTAPHRQNFRILPPVEKHESAMVTDPIDTCPTLDQTVDRFVWWILAGLLVAAGIVIYWGIGR